MRGHASFISKNQGLAALVPPNFKFLMQDPG